MKINIYINNKPFDAFSEKEQHDIKCILSIRSMKAAGFMPEKGGTLYAWQETNKERKRIN